MPTVRTRRDKNQNKICRQHINIEDSDVSSLPKMTKMEKLTMSASVRLPLADQTKAGGHRVLGGVFFFFFFLHNSGRMF
jgi:hypothetical protein